MLNINGNDYRLCLLDTNAVSEMVKRPATLRHFLLWSGHELPTYIPCYSLFTVLELRRNPALWQQFLDSFGPLPSMLLKSHEQLLEEEVLHYPDPSGIDPTLLAFAGEVGSDGNRLAKVLPFAFSDQELLENESYRNQEEAEVVKGMVSLVPNYPPDGGRAYTAREVGNFVEWAGLQQLGMRAEEFFASELAQRRPVNIDAFPSLKAMLYTVFHKFYADRNRNPTRSDAFDAIIASATPYMEAVVTENHQAEVLRKTMRRDKFLDGLHIFTLKDFREAAAPVTAR